MCLDASEWSSYMSGIITSCGNDVDHCVQVSLCVCVMLCVVCMLCVCGVYECVCDVYVFMLMVYHKHDVCSVCAWYNVV